MVSVPDWAKFAQLAQPKKMDSNSLLSKFYKQREAEAVKQAEKYGYFLTPSEEAIIDHCRQHNFPAEDISDYRLIRLTGVHLRVVGDVSMCSKLTICLLANNFLTKFDSLAACRHIIKLDLHSNQLTSIPSAPFWSSLRKLQIVHLHDNPLGKFETLQILGTVASLSILTLFDTPLSLKKNYRHHVVNSVWTLKALDHHVVSDEEIIEDAIFGKRFTALSQPFRIDLCPQTPVDFSFEQEMSVIHLVNATVNAILAKHSPVLIVQRFLRGHLTRQRVEALKLQRGSSKSRQISLPPPGTPIVPSQTSGKKFDYDTYMKNRRPGSEAPEEAFKAQHGMFVDGARLPPSRYSHPLHVNIEKLKLGVLSGLHEKDVVEEVMMAERNKFHFPHSSKKEKFELTERGNAEKTKEEIFKQRRVKDVKQFFGRVIPSGALEEEQAEDSDDEIPMTDFRLKGRKPNLLVADATTEMIISRQDAGQMVREAEEERMRQIASEPKPKVTPHKFTTTDQRIFNRAQSTMGLSCLLAVHKAYREREKAEKTASKMENILGMREERQRAKDRINMYHDERRAQVLKVRDMDRARIIDQLEKKELQRLNFLDKQQENKMRLVDGNKAYKADHSFMKEFNSQHTSVSNALLRHDRQAKNDDVKNGKQGFISNAKLSETEQQDVVKKYMEHRQLMRQTETAMAKAALDTKMLTEANERVMDARNRVAHLKAKRASVQAFYSLPPHTVPPSGTAPAGMSRWEAGVAVSAGRIGRHHTVLI